MSKCKSAVILALSFIFILSCSTKRSVKALKHRIEPNATVAVIVDAPNNVKNAVLARFMNKKFRVQAFNASDLYTYKDIFDIRDFKRISYESNLKADDKSILSLEKTYDNVYKLHIYNFEVNKAQALNEIKDRWNARYLIILDLKDWQQVSWGRAIDLATYELIWIENAPTKYGDTIDTIIDGFINSFSGL